MSVELLTGFTRESDHANDAATACSDVGGWLHKSSLSCYLESLDPGRHPACLSRCSSFVAFDDLGPCYAFQRGGAASGFDENVVRERYRMTPVCMQSYKAFQAKCVSMCRGADEWGQGSCEYVAPVVPKERCADNNSRAPCNDAGCEWNGNGGTALDMLKWKETDRNLVCTTAGGTLDGNECSLPACMPFIESPHT